MCVVCVCGDFVLVDDKGRSREIYLMVYQQGAPLLTHKIICWCYTLRRRGRYRRIKNSVVCFIFGDLFLCMQFYSMGLWIVSMENSNSSLWEAWCYVGFCFGMFVYCSSMIALVDIDTWCSHIFVNIFFLTWYICTSYTPFSNLLDITATSNKNNNKTNAQIRRNKQTIKITTTMWII